MQCSISKHERGQTTRCQGIVFQDDVCWRHCSEEIRRANPGGHTVYDSYNHTGGKNAPMTHDAWVKGVDEGKFWPVTSPMPDGGFKLIPPPDKLVLLQNMVRDAEAEGRDKLDAFLKSQKCVTLGEFIIRRVSPLQREWDRERGVLPRDAKDESPLLKRLFGSAYARAKVTTASKQSQMTGVSGAAALSTQP